MVPAPAWLSTLVIVLRRPVFVPEEINSIVLPTAVPVMLWVAAATVTVVVEPPFAVYVIDHGEYAPQAPAPNVPAKAAEGVWVKPSSE